jgi:hypothetical protein
MLSFQCSMVEKVLHRTYNYFNLKLNTITEFRPSFTSLSAATKLIGETFSTNIQFIYASNTLESDICIRLKYILGTDKMCCVLLTLTTRSRVLLEKLIVAQLVS